jgi:CheY-like chemotaxis protein
MSAGDGSIERWAMDHKPAPDQAERALRILIVDDNKDLADSLCTLLRLWGYDQRAAYDGRSGLEEAYQYHPDCILVDISMPLMDGFAVAQQIRKDPSLERTKLVVQTAYADDETLGRFREMGFDDHLAKPADLTRLRELLENLREARP